MKNSILIALAITVTSIEVPTALIASLAIRNSPPRIPPARAPRFLISATEPWFDGGSASRISRK